MRLEFANLHVFIWVEKTVRFSAIRMYKGRFRIRWQLAVDVRCRNLVLYVLQENPRRTEVLIDFRASEFKETAGDKEMRKRDEVGTEKKKEGMRLPVFGKHTEQLENLLPMM